MDVLTLIMLAVLAVVLESVGERAAEAYWEISDMSSRIDWNKLPDEYYAVPVSTQGEGDIDE